MILIKTKILNDSKTTILSLYVNIEKDMHYS